MNFTTRRPALGAALASRSQLLPALIAATLALGLCGQMPRDATAAASAGLTDDLRVGHTVKDIVVPGTALCTDPTQPCTDENRKIRVHLWYPLDPDQPPGARTQYKSQLHHFPLSEPLLPLSWKVHAELARENAAVDPNGGPFPVIVFSHGNDTDPIDYAHTLERIAAGGFVVAAPYHTNNTQDDLRRDAANTKAGTTLFPCEDGRPEPCARTNIPLGMADRVRDVDKVLDELPDWFGGRVDVDRAGVLGHSRGTVTALAAAGGSLKLDDPRTSPPPGGTRPTCQSRTNPIVVPGAHPEDEPLCWPLHKQGLTRVKAVMGMAIGAPVVNRAVDLEKIQVPTRLFAGELDLTTPPRVSGIANSLIGSADKEHVEVTGAGHRSFASTYCDQTQAAGASADEEDKDRVGNGDGTVDALELQDWEARAFLDHHTASGTVRGAPPGFNAVGFNAVANNNSVTQFCASETFTREVDITSLVGSLLGLTTPFDPASTPAKGARKAAGGTGDFVDSDKVNQDMAEAAVQFFRSKLAEVD